VEILEATEQPLDSAASAIQEGTEAAFPAAISLEWDVWDLTAAHDEAAFGIGIIGIVGQNRGIFRNDLEKSNSLRCFGCVATGQREGEWPTTAIAKGRQLGVASITAHADRLAL